MSTSKDGSLGSASPGLLTGLPFGFGLLYRMYRRHWPFSSLSVASFHLETPRYTLFNLVASWLETAAWKSRDSALTIGDAVTVEPTDTSRPGTTQPAAGSFWAEVVKLPPPITNGQPLPPPERQLYGVRRHGASADAPLEQVSDPHCTACPRCPPLPSRATPAARTHTRRTLRTWAALAVASACLHSRVCGRA